MDKSLFFPNLYPFWISMFSPFILFFCQFSRCFFLIFHLCSFFFIETSRELTIENMALPSIHEIVLRNWIEYVWIKFNSQTQLSITFIHSVQQKDRTPHHHNSISKSYILFLCFSRFLCNMLQAIHMITG